MLSVDFLVNEFLFDCQIRSLVDTARPQKQICGLGCGRLKADQNRWARKTAPISLPRYLCLSMKSATLSCIDSSSAPMRKKRVFSSARS